MFNLCPELASKDFVVDVKFCKVLLQNNKNYPWIILVPRKSNVERLSGLTMEERLQFMREISLCEEVFNELFRPVKITVSKRAIMIKMTDNRFCQH